MYQETIDRFAETATNKVRAMADNPLGFFAAAMMAGAYIGLGIIAVVSVGQGLPPPVRPLAMGLCFAIALVLVVFAGAELFTGYTMVMTFGVLRRTVSPGGLLGAWAMTWAGNLLGAAALSTIFWAGGGALMGAA
jgi:nitrite transporter NirC